jgi:hypothetical protein
MIDPHFKEFPYRISSIFRSDTADRLPGEFFVSLDDVFCLSDRNSEFAFA